MASFLRRHLASFTLAYSWGKTGVKKQREFKKPVQTHLESHIVLQWTVLIWNSVANYRPPQCWEPGEEEITNIRRRERERRLPFPWERVLKMKRHTSTWEWCCCSTVIATCKGTPFQANSFLQKDIESLISFPSNCFSIPLLFNSFYFCIIPPHPEIYSPSSDPRWYFPFIYFECSVVFLWAMRQINSYIIC